MLGTDVFSIIEKVEMLVPSTRRTMLYVGRGAAVGVTGPAGHRLPQPGQAGGEVGVAQPPASSAGPLGEPGGEDSPLRVDLAHTDVRPAVGQPGVDLVTEDDDLVSPADLGDGLQLSPGVDTAAGVAGVGENHEERPVSLTDLPDTGLQILWPQFPVVVTGLRNQPGLVARQPGLGPVGGPGGGRQEDLAPEVQR